MRRLIMRSIRSNRIRLTIVFILVAALSGISVFGAVCTSVTSTDINVNGIVVGTAIVGGGGLPAGCTTDIGWAGTVQQGFISDSPDIGLLNANLFVTGFNAAADATLDKIYVSVHVENDRELRPQDRLVIYFDANGNGGGAWDNGTDFALSYEVGPSMPSTVATGEQCNQDPTNLVQFFKVLGGQFQADVVPAGVTINNKVSWDYDSGGGDPETELWEIEIGIPVAGLNLNAPSSGLGLRIGAKLFIHDIVAGNPVFTLWRWPSTMPALTLATFNPNTPAVTPSQLEQLSFSNCGDVEIVSVTQTSSDDTGNLSNRFYRLNLGTDFSGSNALTSKKNHFSAQVRFFNPSNPGDMSAVAIPNSGNVDFSLRPWNGGFLGTYLMRTPPVQFTTFGQTKTVSFAWPDTKAEYSNGSGQPANDLAGSDHTCLKVKLRNFNVNIANANDEVNRNLTYVTASKIEDSFLLSASGAKLNTGGPLEYVLRVRWRNLPKAIVAPVTQKIDYDKEEWAFEFPDAERVGIRDLGEGYYLVPMRPEEQKRIPIVITGGAMPIPPQVLTLSPRAGGQALPNKSGEPPLEVPVEPGKMVTIISNGTIQLDKEQFTSGPNGFSNPQFRGKRYLLPEGVYDPSETIGALIGSFSPDFKTAFLIGADKTFLVPKDANRLYLGVNDMEAEFDNNGGKGYELNVIISDPLFLPTRLAAGGNPNAGIPAVLEPGSNLPEVLVDVYQMIRNGDQIILRPQGYVAYAVYGTHLREGGGGDTGGGGNTGCGCKARSAASIAFSTLFTVFGLAVLWWRIGRKGRKRDEETEE